MVGGDYYWQFFSGKIVRGIAGPVAMETSLGWVLSGSVPNNSTCNTNALIATHVMKVTGVIDSNKFDRDIVEKIGEFWDIENSESIQFDGKNYSVRLLWKCDPKGLPDNFSLCKSRLNMLVNRLSKNPTKFRVYDDIIEQWETDGVITHRNTDVTNHFKHTAMFSARTNIDGRKFNVYS